MESRNISAIVLCAGSSSRMEGVDKQFLEIEDVPVFIRSLLIFEKSDFIYEIVLVARKDDIIYMKELILKYNITKLKKIVEGGSTRFFSSKIGVDNTSKDCNFILIHDGARPFVTSTLISNICKEVVHHGAVIPAVLLKDTIKVVDSDNFVKTTYSREKLRAVQTPQAFLKSLYLKATEQIKKTENSLTDLILDDATLIENYGKKVFVIPGEYNNIKITVKNDIPFAEYILKNKSE